jgi:hypothetical protein
MKIEETNKGGSFSIKVVTKAKEDGMCRAEITKTQAEDLKKCGSQINSAEDQDPRVHKEFIGLDGKKHKWVYDKENYCYHSYMTNEEWLTLNNIEGLANCQKCAMWEHCRTAQHDISTEWSISQKHIKELSHEIDMQIIERMRK